VVQAATYRSDVLDIYVVRGVGKSQVPGILNQGMEEVVFVSSERLSS